MAGQLIISFLMEILSPSLDRKHLHPGDLVYFSARVMLMQSVLNRVSVAALQPKTEMKEIWCRCDEEIIYCDTCA